MSVKVFEVATEFCRGDSKEITREVAYVTAEDDSLLTVTTHYTRHCFEYEKALKGVREVLTIVEHIVRGKE